MLKILSFIFTAAMAAAQPTIYGMLNAASPTLNAQAVARGSMFVIFGKNAGPADAQKATDTSSLDLAGTSVRFTVGDVNREAPILSNSSSLIVGIAPADLPLGDGSFVLSYNGSSSRSNVRIVNRSFGIFTLSGLGTGPAIAHNVNAAGEYQLNSFLNSAAPGSVMVLWGTGVGPVAADAKVIVGPNAAKTLYAGPSGCCQGIDQIVFEVPAGIEGCFAPVSVDFGDGELSLNFASIAVAAKGGECSDPHGFSGSVLDLLSRNPLKHMGRIEIVGGPGPDGTALIGGFASFWTFEGFASVVPTPPSVGSCTVYAYAWTKYSLLGDSPVGRTGVSLLPGTLNLQGPQGTIAIPVYAPPPDGQPASLPYVGGTYIVENGKGGPDIGPFKVSLDLPNTLVQFTNLYTLSSEIDTTHDLTFTWTGEAGGYIDLTGGGVDDGPGFRCIERTDKGSLTVPAAIWRRLKLGDLGSKFYVSAQAYGFPVNFQTSGLELGQLYYHDGWGGTYFTLK
jgi:uncharacterized protein (TIGR03437 family)